MNTTPTHPIEAVTGSPENSTVQVRTLGRVGLICLNRPRKLNALNGQMMDEASRALQAFSADPDIGAIVLAGPARSRKSGSVAGA